MKHRICRGAVTAAVTAKQHFWRWVFPGCFHGIPVLLAQVETAFDFHQWRKLRHYAFPRARGNRRTRNIPRVRARRISPCAWKPPLQKFCMVQPGISRAVRARVQWMRRRWRRRSPQQGDNQLPAHPKGRAAPLLGDGSSLSHGTSISAMRPDQITLRWCAPSSRWCPPRRAALSKT